MVKDFCEWIFHHTGKIRNKKPVQFIKEGLYMKIGVLGSGNGAHAVAFECAMAGHDVSMFDFPQFDKSIKAIAEAGGIYSDGLLEGFQKITYAGSDISKVVPGADIVFAVGPAYSTIAFGEACAPYVKDCKTFVVMPGSCAGALVFKKALGLEVDDNSVTVADTSTLPYAVRIMGPAKISVMNRLPGGVFLATLPKEKGEELYAALSSVFIGLEKGKGIFHTTLQNGNPVIHPPITTLNAALLERTNGDFLFYQEGVTPAVGNVIKGLDDERIAIGKALGVDIINDPDLSVREGYFTEATYVSGYNTAPGFEGIKAPSSLNYRYYTEDVGYTMLFWIDLANKLGVEVPLMKAMVTLISTIMGRDFAAEAPRTLESVGLGNYSAAELKAL